MACTTGRLRGTLLCPLCRPRSQPGAPLLGTWEDGGGTSGDFGDTTLLPERGRRGRPGILELAVRHEVRVMHRVLVRRVLGAGREAHFHEASLPRNLGDCLVELRSG
eukprot:2730280-Prymnesium_polylepis.1